MAWRPVASTAAPAATTSPTRRRPTCWWAAANGSSGRVRCCHRSDGDVLLIRTNCRYSEYRISCWLFWIWNTQMNHPIRISGQLGPALRALRERRGWSQTELGRRIGLSQERISSIERQPERITVGQLLTVLMALDAELRVGARAPAPPGLGW